MKRESLLYRNWLLLRSCIQWIMVLIFIAWFVTFIMPPALFMRTNNYIRWAGIFFGNAIRKILRIQIDGQGLEQIYRDGPCVIVSNHQSLLDIPILYSIMRIHITWMAKASLFKIPFMGMGMRIIDCIPVERENRKKAQESLFQAAEQVRTGVPVIIFPEGTRGFPNGEMRSFKKGGFVIAQKANVVIQPITIWGAGILVQKRPDQLIQRCRSGYIHVVAHKPIQPEEYANMTNQELSDHIQKIIENPMAEMREKYPIEVVGGERRLKAGGARAKES